MDFKTIVSIPPLQLKPTALTKLAHNFNNEEQVSSSQIPLNITNLALRSPRSLDEIMQDLEQGKADNISLLEWVYCIHQKASWDSYTSREKQLATSRLIWQCAIDNDGIKRRLCWRLAYYYDGYLNQIAPSFVETFSTLSEILQDDLTINILIILKQRDPLLFLVTLAKEEALTPKELFATAQLPTQLSVVEDSLEYVVTAFFQELEAGGEWLVNCFQEMKTAQQVSNVETLLKNVSPDSGNQFPNLVEWLQNNYSSRIADSKWQWLSSEGKKALRKWFGAANYQDFQTIVDLILKRLNLPHWEANQLDSRKYFWEQYSDQFERIRILLPQSSVNVVENQDIDILQEDGSEKTEVCIFDFGDWFVVEFFRGTGSETRLFNRHQYPNIEQELFASSQLSIKRLRFLGGEVHDHKYLWQFFCERWLWQRNILPNDGTTHFKRRNPNNPNKPFLDRYDPNKGLPVPNAEKQEKREKNLVRWRRDIEKLEAEAKQYWQKRRGKTESE
ncbi:hypothetical protein FRE64_14255 [Euhalothece natronophila Z-M001]|uniref:Zorya protein ZorC EH domain-containing protein n=1 Tax=Euhalothece natronophila Z-M001 TaxID=522448 RepID=A0A5B8NSI6_9CHRO|nr:EH signature domain-containing protein [Euhalothece natronophila]QDZ41000.1 hypothetical protein FRE64_14255 [Euhalothece natronophila Z-M001]